MRHADHVRERRHAARPDHRAAMTARRASMADARRLDVIVGAGAVRPGGGDLGAARRAPAALVFDGGASWRARSASYPTYVRFFSTAEKLSLGGLPFVVAERQAERAATRSRTTARWSATSGSPCGSTSRCTPIDGRAREASSSARRTRGGDERAIRAARGGRGHRILRLAEPARRAGRRAAARGARLPRRARGLRAGRRRRGRRQLGGRGGAGSVAVGARG